MKKILNSFIFVIFAALAFNACSDVPAPYDIPGMDDGETEEGVYIDETFSTSLGSFTSISAQGNLSWTIDYKSACITGFQDYDGDGQKENQAGITYLVSPTIDLSASTGAYITFDHALEYERGSISDNNQLVISKDYAGDVNTANWEVLSISYDGVNNGAGSGSDGFNFESAGNISIPAAYIGEGNTAITVALRHTCDDSFSSTWEVQNFKMAEGTGEDTDNPDNPDNPEGGTAENPYTVAEAQSIIANGSYTNDKVYVKGIISQIDEVAPDFGNATYFISDDGSTNGQLEVFRGYYLGGEKFTSADQIKVGDEVIVYGALTLYVNDYGETPEISTGSQIYSLNGTTSEVGGGEQGGGEGGETGGDPQPGGEVEGNSITVAASAFGLANATELTTLPLTDGTVLSFDGGGGRNVPAFYAAGDGSIRMYPSNTMTITSEKTVTGVTLHCDEYQGTTYNASGNLTATSGSISADGATITLSGASASSLTITNANTGSGTATQLRIVSMTIHYAE